MNDDTYLKQLETELESFSAETRADLLDEITTHIEESLEKVGDEKQFSAEMGSPRQMADGFKNLLRPNRFHEFLLAMLPVFLIIPVLNIVAIRLFPVEYAPLITFGLAALVGLIMVAVSWRRSAELKIHWLTGALISLVMLTLLQTSFITGAQWEFSFSEAVRNSATVAAVGVGIALFATVRRKQFDPFLTTFAILPLLLQISNLFSTTHLTSMLGAGQFGERMLFIAPAGHVLTVLVLALIFLSEQRTMRWLGLYCYAGFALLEIGFLAWPQWNQPLVFLSVIAVQLIVPFGWLWDRRQRDPYQVA